MNFEIDKPKHLISLASSALLLNVEVKVWTATKQDRAISNEVTTSKNASSDAGKFTQNLLANSPDHKALLNYRQTVTNWLQRRTYDWAGGWRILPTVELERAMKELNEHKAAFNKLKQTFMAKYSDIVSDAAFKQGTMFDRSAYPDVLSLDGRFTMRELISDVPTNDFRSGGIAEAIADDLQQHFTRRTRSIVDDVMNDASERLLAIAERISSACAEPEANDDGKTKRKKIYDTTVSQAKEICNTLKHFNLTNNEALEDARMRLEETLKGVTTEELRESAYERRRVKDSVDDILSKFQPLRVQYD